MRWKLRLVRFLIADMPGLPIFQVAQYLHRQEMASVIICRAI